MNRRWSAVPLAAVLLSFLWLPASALAAEWRRVGLAYTDLGAVAVPAAPLGALYISQPDAILRSPDRGATFLSVGLPYGPCPISATPHLAVDPTRAGVLYATHGTNLLQSVDGGATWHPTTSPGIGWLTDVVALPDAPGHLLAVGDSSVLPPLSPAPPCYPALSSHGIALSTDGGATWTVPVAPFASLGDSSAAAVDPAPPHRLYLGTTQGNLFFSENGGATLLALASPPAPLGITELRVDATTSPSTLFARSAGQLYRTTLRADGTALPWTRLDRAPEMNSLSRQTLVFDPHRPGTLYAFSLQGVSLSTDRGDSWQLIEGLDPFGISQLALDPRPNGPLYAATREGLYALDRSRCVEDTDAGCVAGFRYRVEVTFERPGGEIFLSHVQALSADTVDAWFFAPGNVELLVKVLDGRSLNGDFWVFAGGLSDVKYTLTVTDTETGAVKIYRNPPGRLASFADTSAFPVAGSASAAAARPVTAPSSLFLPDISDTAGCAAGSTALCLAGSRFAVSVAWSGGPFAGAGHTIPLTDDTGAFWFLNPDNLELAVKVLDGRGLNGHFWVFYGALSDFAYTVTVTDTETGAVRTYTNPRGHLASFADTSAF